MAAAAKDPRLKKRPHEPLQRSPRWLKLAHEKLDRAVLVAATFSTPAAKTPLRIIEDGHFAIALAHRIP